MLEISSSNPLVSSAALIAPLLRRVKRDHFGVSKVLVCDCSGSMRVHELFDISMTPDEQTDQELSWVHMLYPTSTDNLSDILTKLRDPIFLMNNGFSSQDQISAVIIVNISSFYLQERSGYDITNLQSSASTVSQELQEMQNPNDRLAKLYARLAQAIKEIRYELGSPVIYTSQKMVATTAQGEEYILNPAPPALESSVTVGITVSAANKIACKTGEQPEIWGQLTRVGSVYGGKDTLNAYVQSTKACPILWK